MARLICAPLVREGSTCAGCGKRMDVFGDHAVTCSQGRGAIGGWKIRRHDQVADILFQLGRDAGLRGRQLSRERREPASNHRPADIHAAVPSADAGESSPELDDMLFNGADNGPDQRFEETSYDITITATHKSKTGTPAGVSSAATKAGAEGVKATRAKEKKYEELRLPLLEGARGRRRFEPLVFESSGYTMGDTTKLIKRWAKMADERVGVGRRGALHGASRFLRARAEIGSTIQRWNAVSIMLRADPGLLVLMR